MEGSDSKTTVSVSKPVCTGSAVTGQRIKITGIGNKPNRRRIKPRVLRRHWRALFHIIHGYAAFCNIALAVVTTLSTVNPNSFCRAFSGAEPPNVCMPMTRPVEPT